MILFSFTNLPNLNARFEPLSQEVKDMRVLQICLRFGGGDPPALNSKRRLMSVKFWQPLSFMSHQKDSLLPDVKR